METKELDSPYKEEFLEIKDRCKSRAKKNFWGGLAVVLLVGRPFEDALVESVLCECTHDGGRHLGLILLLGL